jgi:hypothetical protein
MLMKSVALFLFLAYPWGEILIFTFPHQIVSLVISSSTILLSVGLLPVLNPDEAESAPLSVMVV